MKIAAGRERGMTQSSGARKKEPVQMQRAELTEDIFNNRPTDAEDRRAARLFLSNGSRQLTKAFKEHVMLYLKEEQPELNRRLQQIELPEEAMHQLPQTDQQLRRLRLYLQWLEQPNPTADGAFAEIQNLELDEELKELWIWQEEERQDLLRLQHVHSFGYFYQVRPQNYAFN